MMSVGLFEIVFVAAAGLIAGWTFLRVTRVAPSDMRQALIHMGLALVACQLVAPAASTLLSHSGWPELRVAALIGIALPSLAYAMLALIWLLAQLQATIRRGTIS